MIIIEFSKSFDISSSLSFSFKIILQMALKYEGINELSFPKEIAISHISKYFFSSLLLKRSKI